MSNSGAFKDDTYGGENPEYHFINQTQNLTLHTLTIKNGKLESVLHEGYMLNVEKSFDPDSYYIRYNRRIIYIEVIADEINGITNVVLKRINSAREEEDSVLYNISWINENY